jgi:GrpB-like predicted nucleotidyltransferase (UPF0157 family)
VETLDERIQSAVREDVGLVPYDPKWPILFEREREHLRACLPAGLIGRIEHFGSTAIPGITAKPIIDILVEVASLEETGTRIIPVLEAQGYDYFWRPTWGDDVPPWYAWFIKRDSQGRRTHHIHMVEPDFEHWERLLFRDYLIEHPDVARQYGELKVRLARAHVHDRIAYTRGKSEFIVRWTRIAKEHYGKGL